MKTLSLVLLLCAATTVSAQNEPEDQTNRDTSQESKSDPAPKTDTNFDEEFITHAIKSGKVERRLCEFAGSRVSDIRIKEFANEVMRDHILASRELKALAAALTIEVKAETADEAVAREHEALKTKSGAEFDKAFLEELAKAHEKAIKLFQTAQQQAKGDGVKGFVAKTLPVLNRHADRIAALSGTPRRPPAAADASAPSTPPQPGNRPPGNPGTTPDNIPVPPKKA